jgi:hypothetical protein
MELVRYEKVVSSLPWTLTANTIYLVRTGTGFDMYVTNDTGLVVAYPVNSKNTFETVSKNLSSYNWAFNYTGVDLTSIVYTIPSVWTITKTLNYTSWVLTSIVLSGNTPGGIALTKTLWYTSGVLTSVTYS